MSSPPFRPLAILIIVSKGGKKSREEGEGSFNYLLKKVPLVYSSSYPRRDGLKFHKQEGQDNMLCFSKSLN